MTTISRALQPPNDRIWCLVDRNHEFFYLPTLIFISFLDNVEIIVIKCVSGKKSKGHWPFKSINCDWTVVEFQSQAVVRHDGAGLESTFGPDEVKSIRLRTAERKAREIGFCADYFLLSEGQLCVLLQLFEICGISWFTQLSLWRTKETFVWSSLHWSSSRWNQELT